MSGITDKKIEFGGREAGKSYRRFLARSTILAGGMFALAASPLTATRAQAQTVQLGDFTVTLQSTLGYTLGVRTSSVNNDAPPFSGLSTGDKNFRSGIIANRFQTLEQLNVQDGNYGLRASALAYLDTVYLQHSDNPGQTGNYGIGPQGFPSGTIANEGRRIEPLALFLYGAEYLNNGNDKISWQLGRQTITWGESLFSFNGISGLQAPADFYQGSLLPNPQAQALFLPTGAAQLAVQFANGVTLDGYWQFEYETDILPGVGSYFSTSDVVGPGAQQIVAGPGVSIYRAHDIRPPNGLNQFGLSGHYNYDNNYELGLYFVQGIPKLPGVETNITNPPTVGLPPKGASNFSIGTYNIYYPKPVDAIAASVSTLFMTANVAAEVSDRINQPLLSAPNYVVPGSAKYSDPLYAEGNVFVGLVSAIYLAPPLPLFPNGIAFTTELSGSDVTSVNKKNAAALVGGLTSYGMGYNLQATPNWFPTADIEIDTPVSWGTTFVGDSEFDGSTAGSSTYNIGIKAVYKTNLTVGFNYKRNSGTPQRQSFLDRDFASFYVQRTF